MRTRTGEWSAAKSAGRPRRFRAAGRCVVALLALAVAGTVFLPVTTRQGVDYVVITKQVPLYLKLIDFVDRDLNYRALARRITDAEDAPARLMALVAWTRSNIRDAPPGLPVIDDHVWHIIVRGYGVDDQKTDVFATLATYAGLPAYWTNLRRDGAPLPIALVRVGGAWRVLDVANGVEFRNGRGELATPEEIAADPALVARAGRGRLHRGRPYAEYFEGFKPPVVPAILRAEKQMPWPRLVFEVKRNLARVGSRLGLSSPPDEDSE